MRAILWQRSPNGRQQDQSLEPGIRRLGRKPRTGMPAYLTMADVLISLHRFVVAVKPIADEGARRTYAASAS